MKYKFITAFTDTFLNSANETITYHKIIAFNPEDNNILSAGTTKEVVADCKDLEFGHDIDVDITVGFANKAKVTQVLY